MPENPNIEPGNAARDFIDAFNYIDASDQQSEAAVMAAALGDPTYNHMLKEGFDPSEAAYVALGPERLEAITAGERALAELQYGPALAATGLKFEDFYQIDVQVADVRTFMNALRRTQVPDDATAARRLRQGLADLTQKLLDTTERAVAIRNKGRFEAAGGGPPAGLNLESLWDAMADADEPLELVPGAEAAARDAEMAALSAEVIDHAEVLADRLAGLYPSEHPEGPEEGAGMTRSLRQLQRAVNQGLLIEWAVAQSMQLLDTSEIGVSRLMNDSEWERVYRLLDHLNIKAPQATFTRELRRAVLADITAVLEAPFDPTEGGRVVFGTITIVEETPDPLQMEIDMIEQGPQEPQVASQEESNAYRARQRAVMVEILEEARERVRFALPPPAAAHAATGAPETPAGSVGRIVVTLYHVERTLGDAGLEVRDIHEALSTTHATLASTLEGSSSEHARQVLEQFSAALGHLAAFLEASGNAVAYFSRYKL